MAAVVLVTVAAAIMVALGGLHLLFTFRGPKLRPRDPALEARMQAVAPGITAQSTMWKLWIGFNVSHSLGLLLFGLVYGYLALTLPALLFASRFLCVLGALVLLTYVWASWRYWFSGPLTGALAALLAYTAGLGCAWL